MPIFLQVSRDDDLDLLTAAERALSESSITELRSVSVSIQGERLVLRGRVSSYYLKQLAKAKVEAVAQDYAVVINEIQVVHSELLGTVPPSPLRNSPEPAPQRILLAKVSIFIPQADEIDDADAIEGIRKAICNTFDEFGFEPSLDDPSAEEFGSWWATFWFRSKQAITGDEAQDVFRELRETIRRKNLDTAGADVFSTRAEAIDRLLAHMERFDEVAMRLGDVLMAKAVIDGKVRILVETISAEMARELEKQPMLMRNPQALFEIGKHVANPRTASLNKEVNSSGESRPS